MPSTDTSRQSEAVRRHWEVSRRGWVLTVTPTGISRITVFGGGAGLVARFGLPAGLG